MKKELKTEGVILTEGAIVERLKYEFGLKMDPFINHAGTIYDYPDILEIIYKQYIDVAQKYEMPIMLMTPTRKVSFESLQLSKYRNRNVILDSIAFLNNIRNQNQTYKNKIFIGGLMGCRGDAFHSMNALSETESYKFHKVQVSEFMKGNIDFLFAGIMPNIFEASGMAKAMAESGFPYIISFSIEKNGCLLDGTSIIDAISTIDKNASILPLGYMANCIHPLNLRLALENELNSNTDLLNRFIGIQANASSLCPKELNKCGILQKGNFDEMVNELIYLKNKYHFKVIGGCCGTDNVFIEKLARRLSMP